MAHSPFAVPSLVPFSGALHYNVKNIYCRLGVVVHLVIPATWEAEIRRIHGQPRQKISEIFSKSKLDMVAHACNSNYTGGVGRQICLQPGLGKSKRLYLKNN
jgi:hypothetical protein